MQLPKEVESAIRVASVRASHVFHECEWEWVGIGIPNSVQIQERYTMLAEDVLEQASVKDPDTLLVCSCGTCMNGRLVVDLTDGIWTFTVILADYVEED